MSAPVGGNGGGEQPPVECIGLGDVNLPSARFPLTNFVRSVQWSPNGKYLLACGEDEGMRVMQLSTDIAARSTSLDSLQSIRPNEDGGVLTEVAARPAGEPVYDSKWAPPCLHDDLVAISSRDHPIQIWDPATDSIRTTLSPENNVHELKSALTVAWSGDAQSIYAGFRDEVQVFSIGQPREKPVVHKIKGNQRNPALPGLVSCIKEHPENPNFIAVASFSNKLAMFDLKNEKHPLMYSLRGHTGGITHMCWSKEDPRYLYTGARKDNKIRCWDLRNSKDTVFTMERSCENNQRMLFDIDWGRRHLLSGTQDGRLRAFNLKKKGELAWEMNLGRCVNSVALHPSLPLMCLGSGTREFPEIEDTEDVEPPSALARLPRPRRLRRRWRGEPGVVGPVPFDSGTDSDDDSSSGDGSTSSSSSSSSSDSESEPEGGHLLRLMGAQKRVVRPFTGTNDPLGRRSLALWTGPELWRSYFAWKFNINLDQEPPAQQPPSKPETPSAPQPAPPAPPAAKAPAAPAPPAKQAPSPSAAPVKEPTSAAPGPVKTTGATPPPTPAPTPALTPAPTPAPAPAAASDAPRKRPAEGPAEGEPPKKVAA